MKQGALILSIGGTLAALIGSIGVIWAPWASRTMLLTNIVVIAGSVVEHVRQRTAQRRAKLWYENSVLTREQIAKTRFNQPRQGRFFRWTRDRTSG